MLSILVLVVAAVFAVVKAVEWVDGDSGGSTSASTVVGSSSSTPAEERCEFSLHGGELGIEVASRRPDCAEARRIYTRYRSLAEAGESNGYELTPVGAGWSCAEFPFSQYPLMGRCENGGLIFDVFGLAPSAHLPP